MEAKLQALSYRPELFRAAFGDSTVTEAPVRRAIAQFERAMVGSNSRWDTAYASVYNPALPDKGLLLPLPGFTPQEERGRSGAFMHDGRFSTLAQVVEHCNSGVQPGPALNFWLNAPRVAPPPRQARSGPRPRHNAPRPHRPRRAAP